MRNDYLERPLQEGDKQEKVKWGFFQKLRGKFDGAYFEYKHLQLAGIEYYGAMKINGPYGDVAIKQPRKTEVDSANPNPPVQQPHATTTEDVYRGLISLAGRMSDDQRFENEKLMDTMRYMNQDNQAGETSRHERTVSELTKSLYNMQQENTKAQSTLVSEISGFRKDYADMQIQYQHMLKETGNQVDKIIKAYEQQRDKDMLFLKEFMVDYKKDHESILEKSNGMLKIYVEEARRSDEKMMGYFMENSQRDRNMLTSTIEKMMGYQQKPAAAKKKPSARKGVKRPGIATLSSGLTEIGGILRDIRDNQIDQIALEKRAAFGIENAKNSFDEFSEAMSRSN